ncbi:MAG TPA: hydroxyacid dehydrogenase [Candidatus Binatia bacterium]|jgi:D-3-phosphoglycerate dehydrogenase|nr:hydroxyacid dehydrogenase [Candidatus Binatia bacterium]
MDILISEDLQGPAIERLAQRYQIVRDGGLWKEPQRLLSTIGKARALMVRNQTQVTAELLRAAPELLGVGRLGVGLDNIDVATATSLGVVVVAPFNANATSVAELTLGLILALARKIPQADRSTKEGAWDRKGCTGIELAGKTLAICGLGRIGGLVASRARAFGMKLVAFDLFVKPDSPALRESGALLRGSLEEALSGADFVSVHLPLTSETQHVFSRKMFAATKPGAYFVNTSRGGVVDETALLEALQTGQLAGAGLDVRETEPPVKKGVLESLPNVLLMPHIGAFTAEAQERTFEAVAGDMDRLLSGQPVVNFVNMDRPKR